jgi:hypothetical protein
MFSMLISVSVPPTPPNPSRAVPAAMMGSAPDAGTSLLPKFTKTRFGELI